MFLISGNPCRGNQTRSTPRLRPTKLRAEGVGDSAHVGAIGLALERLAG